MDCLSKGKARIRYEFGNKVSIATEIDEGFVVGMRASPGKPCDGHSLAETLEQVAIVTERPPSSSIAAIVATAQRKQKR